MILVLVSWDWDVSVYGIGIRIRNQGKAPVSAFSPGSASAVTRSEAVLRRRHRNTASGTCGEKTLIVGKIAFFPFCNLFTDDYCPYGPYIGVLIRAEDKENTLSFFSYDLHFLWKVPLTHSEGLATVKHHPGLQGTAHRLRTWYASRRDILCP